MLLVKEKEIVVPGETLAEGAFLIGRGVYKSDTKIISKRLGILHLESNRISVIPLSGKYVPKIGDVVIGQVSEIYHYGWRIDIGAPFNAILLLRDAITTYVSPSTDLSKFYAIRDWIRAKIINITPQKIVELTTKGPGLKKLKNGRIIQVNAFKIPRIIGKEGSMINLIKNLTDCEIFVGQNGFIWISGLIKNQFIAIQALKLVELEAHLSGLTDKVKAFIEKLK